MKKRIVAYLLDIILISMFSSLISSIPFINKDYNEYRNTYGEYSDKIKDFNNLKNDFNDYSSDYEISLEEYEKLTNDYPSYADYFKNKYEELNLSNEKLDDDMKNTIILELIDINKDIFNDYAYKLAKLEIIPSIINIVCIIVYFVFVQYFLNGQTLGKRILNIKVVKKNNEKASILNLFIRTIILMGTIFTVCNLVCLQFLSKTDYLNINFYISCASNICSFAIIVVLCINKGEVGLHDLIGNTKVVPIDNNLDSAKIIESNDNNINC